METSTLGIQRRQSDLLRTWHPRTAPRTLISKEKISAPAIGKEQLEDVKTKLDSVHKLLKKHVSFAEDAEAVDADSDMDEEEDVNFVSGSGFQNQRSENQSGYINSYGNGQKSGYNQSSQY